MVVGTLAHDAEVPLLPAPLPTFLLPRRPLVFRPIASASHDSQPSSSSSCGGGPAAPGAGSSSNSKPIWRMPVPLKGKAFIGIGAGGGIYVGGGAMRFFLDLLSVGTLGVKGDMKCCRGGAAQQMHVGTDDAGWIGLPATPYAAPPCSLGAPARPRPTGSSRPPTRPPRTQVGRWTGGGGTEQLKLWAASQSALCIWSQHSR